MGKSRGGGGGGDWSNGGSGAQRQPLAMIFRAFLCCKRTAFPRTWWVPPGRAPWSSYLPFPDVSLERVTALRIYFAAVLMASLEGAALICRRPSIRAGRSFLLGKYSAAELLIWRSALKHVATVGQKPPVSLVRLTSTFIICMRGGG